LENCAIFLHNHKHYKYYGSQGKAGQDIRRNGVLVSSVNIFATCAIILVGGHIFDPSLVTGATIKNPWQAPTVGFHAGDTAFGGFFHHGIMDSNGFA
jgi:hypothetical protein